ncbi:MAG: DUF2892 domain-containing protein [Cyclobacteriaceae bacterium]
MKKNMSKTDSIIRILIAVVIGALYYMGVISGTLAIILLVVSVVFVLTSVISFCPLYRIFGIKTCSVKKGE